MPHQVTHHGQNTGIGLLRILQMNPIYRALYLHRQVTMGAIEARRFADLVLLHCSAGKLCKPLRHHCGCPRWAVHRRKLLDVISYKAAAALQ